MRTLERTAREPMPRTRQLTIEIDWREAAADAMPERWDACRDTQRAKTYAAESSACRQAHDRGENFAETIGLPADPPATEAECRAMFLAVRDRLRPDLRRYLPDIADAPGEWRAQHPEIHKLARVRMAQPNKRSSRSHAAAVADDITELMVRQPCDLFAGWWASALVHEMMHAAIRCFIGTMKPRDGAHGATFRSFLLAAWQDLGADAAALSAAFHTAGVADSAYWAKVTIDDAEPGVPAAEPAGEPRQAAAASGGWELREFDQQRIVDAVAASPQSRVMVQAETGSGKTVMASTIAAAAAVVGDSVVWMAHRRELLQQAFSALVTAGIAPDSIRYWPMQHPEPGTVTLMSAQAVTHPEPGTVDLLIADEAHHSVARTWREKLAGMKPKRAIGWTATPFRTSRFEGFDHLWHELITGPSYRQLVEAKALAPYELVVPEVGARVRRQQLVTDEFGEFSDASVAVEVRRLLATGDAVKAWNAAAFRAAQVSTGDIRTLWFAVSLESARDIAGELAANGMAAEVLAGSDKRSERVRKIAEFRSGKLTHLVTVDIATEGLDIPECSIVVHLRPTTSLGLYRQMNGRALRYAPGKTAIILDPVGNTEQHGTPDRPIKWQLAPRGERCHGDAPVTICPVCEQAGDEYRNPLGCKKCRQCGARLIFGCRTCQRQQTWRSFHPHNYTSVHDGDECRECAEAVAHFEASEFAAMLARLGLGMDNNGQLRLTL